MTPQQLETLYGDVWKLAARSEGHRKRLPDYRGSTACLEVQASAMRTKVRENEGICKSTLRRSMDLSIGDYDKRRDKLQAMFDNGHGTEGGLLEVEVNGAVRLFSGVKPYRKWMRENG